MAHFTVVRPILEYGCAARDPYLSRDIKTLKKIEHIFRLQGMASFTEMRKKT